MKAATFEGTGKIVVKDVPDPVLQNPGQAIVRVTHSCICGSDLWFYRGLSSQGEGSRIGHEFMGVVEAVGGWCQDRHGRRLRHRIVRHLRRR
jgi:alcohol dehydrogenase